jgi:hypothetical protein
MEENITTELQLSEEQLQTITGGCNNCTEDKISIARFNRQDKAHRALHQIALETGFPTEAQKHLAEATYASTMSQLLGEDIMNRHRIPGGNTVPGGSSGNELAKK